MPRDFNRRIALFGIMDESCPTGRAMNDHAWITVTLREWVESQRNEHTPHRAALLEAVDRADIGTIRDLMAEAPFDDGQRRYLDDLLTRWEEMMSGEVEGNPDV